MTPEQASHIVQVADNLLTLGLVTSIAVVISLGILAARRMGS